MGSMIYNKLIFSAVIMMIFSVPFASGYSLGSPADQLSKGIDPHEVQCKEDFELVFKSTDFTPACVKFTSVPKLIERGWASEHDPMHMDMMK